MQISSASCKTTRSIGANRLSKNSGLKIEGLGAQISNLCFIVSSIAFRAKHNTTQLGLRADTDGAILGRSSFQPFREAAGEEQQVWGLGLRVKGLGFGFMVSMKSTVPSTGKAQYDENGSLSI